MEINQSYMKNMSPVLSNILGQTKEHILWLFCYLHYIMSSQVDGAFIPFTIPFMITIKDLPSEVLIHILSFISLQDLRTTVYQPGLKAVIFDYQHHQPGNHGHPGQMCTLITLYRLQRPV